MPLAAWLVSLVGPLVARAIISLGFTAVSFAGVTLANDALMTIAKNSWSALPAAVLQVATISGIPQALGMIASAYAAKLAVWFAANSSKYILNK